MAQSIETPEITPAAQTPPGSSTQPPRKRTPKLQRLLLLILLVALGGSAMYAYQNSNKPAASVPEVKVIRKTAPPPVIFKDGVKWLGSAQPIADLGIITLGSNNDLSGGTGDGAAVKVNYFKVGTDAGNDIILAVPPSQGLGGGLSALLVKNSRGGYDLLKQHTKSLYDQNGNYNGLTVSGAVSANSTKIYDSVAYQKTLALNKAVLTSPSDNLVDFAFYTSRTTHPLITAYSLPYGQVYTRTLGAVDGFSIQDFVLQMLDQQATNYQLRPSFVTDDNVPQVKWNDGSLNKDAYRTDGIGSCGSAVGLAVMNSNSLTGLVPTGKTSAGETIYAFTDNNNPILKYLYNAYAIDSGTNKPVANAISLTQYQAKHGVFVYRDALKRNIIFASTTYGSQAECGKPVIYLYPTHPTKVSVKVDARITKSDPAYGNGWLVDALPDGTLLSGGRTYDSLFWEGTGHEYPAITAGFVVSQAQLVTTISSQLGQLGLNPKETADFLDFWQPRLPKTPFVRLSWLGTNDMNRLAPLHIKPAPDTLIRLFLDFEGLKKPIQIQPQTLRSIPRQGFTVVEWGGLLRP